MSINKILNPEEWNIATGTAENLATVTVHLTYPTIDSLEGIASKNRRSAIDDRMRGYLAAIIQSGLLLSHSISTIGRRPRSVEAEITLGNLSALCKLPGVGGIAITKVVGLKKKRQRPSKKLRFHCVKMTVAIQIEGAKKGLQKYEERYVLIKAASCEDANRRVEATRDEYAKPYLNSDGYLVRWQIESLDDCYETGIEKSSEFNASAGVGVFSILKERRLTPERSWDGK